MDVKSAPAAAVAVARDADVDDAESISLAAFTGALPVAMPVNRAAAASDAAGAAAVGASDATAAATSSSPEALLASSSSPRAASLLAAASAGLKVVHPFGVHAVTHTALRVPMSQLKPAAAQPDAAAAADSKVSPAAAAADNSALSPWHVDVPLGTTVVRWDVRTHTRLGVMAQAPVLVTALSASPCGRFIACVCFDGGVAVYDAAWTPLCNTFGNATPVVAFTNPVTGKPEPVDFPPAKHIAWAPNASPDGSTHWLATACVSETGPVRVFTLSRWASSGQYTLAPSETIVGSFVTCQWNALNQLLAFQTAPIKAAASHRRGGGAKPAGDASSAAAAAAATEPANKSTLQLYSVDGKLLRQAFFDGVWSANGHAFNPYDHAGAGAGVAAAGSSGSGSGVGQELAVSFRDRTVIVLDSVGLRPLYPPLLRRDSGSGQMFCVVWWDADHVLLPSDNGQYRVCHKAHGGAVAAQCYGPGHATWLAWAVPRERLWVSVMGELRSLSLVGKLKAPAPLSAAVQAQVDAAVAAATDGAASTAAAKAAPNPSPVLDDATKAAADLKQQAATNWMERCATYEIAFSGVACTGVSFSGDGTCAVTGDLAGNVVVWSCSNRSGQSDGGGAPLHVANVGVGVRCVAWKKAAGEGFAFGCLDGSAWYWNPMASSAAGAGASKSAPKQVFATTGTIACMAWENGYGHGRAAAPQRLAVGTTDGKLVVMRHTPSGAGGADEPFRVEQAFVAHKPVDTRAVGGEAYRQQFGSLHLAADVWSVCWSPDNRFVATASEDQTTAIWDLATGTRVRELRGHTTAVTGVCWERMQLNPSADASAPLTDVLVTCADDQTAMVWLPPPLSAAGSSSSEQPWKQLCTLRTASLRGWYTITYAALEAGGTRYACGTMSGHVVVWDLAARRQVFCGRTHNGSVEGMDWSGAARQLATCSSDCSVNFYAFPSAAGAGAGAGVGARS